MFGDTRTAPLYRSNFREDVASPLEWYCDGTESSRVNDVISLFDLQYVLKKLMRASTTLAGNHLQHRAWLVTLYLAAGRGREIKFVDFTEWTWHSRIQAVDIGWTELKVTGNLTTL